MNSKEHLIISLVKSGISIAGGIITLLTGSIIPLSICIVVAEIGGILEELLDKR